MPTMLQVCLALRHKYANNGHGRASPLSSIAPAVRINVANTKDSNAFRNVVQSFHEELPSETEQAILVDVSPVNNLNVIPQEWKKADLLVYRDPELCQRIQLETDD